jgi:dTDP-glucose 4,6-dehydratase
MNILLTGGLGFIGLAVIRRLIGTTDHVVINVDKQTYAASHETMGGGARPSPPRPPQG